jgi:hypothetical protein
LEDRRENLLASPLGMYRIRDRFNFLRKRNCGLEKIREERLSSYKN